LTDDNKHLRKFADVVVTLKATPRISLAGSLDRGRQSFPGRPAANWLGAGVYARYAFGNHHAIGVRAERFDDPRNGISGTAQTLTETTLTYEYRPRPHLIAKFERRRDHSTAAVFDDSRHQTLLIAGVVATF
jgi:hypothetical protein